MDISLIELVQYVAYPIAGVIGWLAAGNTRKQDYTQKLLDTIKLLVDHKDKQFEKIIELQQIAIDAKGNNMQLTQEIEKLKLENDYLVRKNTDLSNKIKKLLEHK